MRIEAATLDKANIEATKRLGCSILQIDIKVIQMPRAGFLGFFARPAIIEANRKQQRPFKEPKPRRQTPSSPQTPPSAPAFSAPPATPSAPAFDEPSVPPVKNDAPHSTPSPSPLISPKPPKPKMVINDAIFDSFHRSEPMDSGEMVEEIKQSVNKLMAASCFDIAVIDVFMCAENTISIHLDGDDAALLIGKEGYRYKALSYMLFNWLNSKYNLNLRLEIAQFLANQEASIAAYLAPIIERVEQTGKAQTKPLDGVLVKIALEQLRARFPNKYVGIRGEGAMRYVAVSDFYKQ